MLCLSSPIKSRNAHVCRRSSEATQVELRDTTNPRLALIVLDLQALVVVEQLWRVLHVLDLLLKVWFNCRWLDGGFLLEDGTAHGCGKSQHQAKETDL